MKAKVVIYGGAGYVGNAVAEFMKGEFQVVIADIKPPESLDGLQYERCDVRDSSQVRRTLSGASAAMYFSVVQIPQINSEKRLGYEVNVLGLQNVCEAAFQSETSKCVVESGTWHVFGEVGLTGTITESFGFRPDNVEERAKTYALCKIAQESVMRIYDSVGESLGKVYGVLRMGTVLGEKMPGQTAASLFINNGLKGTPLTPYKSSMYRPMLYVDIVDVCRAYTNFVRGSLRGGDSQRGHGPPHLVNLWWPQPLTVLELAEIVRDTINEQTKGKITPVIEVKDTGVPMSFRPDDKDKFKVDISRARELLGGDMMTSPRDSIKRIVGKMVMLK